MPPKRHADLDDHKADQDRHEIARRLIALVGEGEDHQQEQRGADNLIQQSRGQV